MRRSHSNDAVCPLCKHATLPESVGTTGREKALAAALTAEEVLDNNDNRLLAEAGCLIDAITAELGPEATERVRQALAALEGASDGDQELDRLAELPE